MLCGVWDKKAFLDAENDKTRMHAHIVIFQPIKKWSPLSVWHFNFSTIVAWMFCRFCNCMFDDSNQRDRKRKKERDRKEMVELFRKMEKRKTNTNTNTRLPNHLTDAHRHMYVYTRITLIYSRKIHQLVHTHTHWVTYWPLIHADQNRLYDWRAVWPPVSSVFVNGQFNIHCIREIMFPFVSKWKIQRACARACACVCTCECISEWVEVKQMWYIYI